MKNVNFMSRKGLLAQCVALFSCMLFFASCETEEAIHPQTAPDNKEATEVSTSETTSLTPVEIHGQLQVQGNKIVDKNGNPVQLRGMSLFWSQWIGQYYNYDAIKWLKDDWNINVIRAAMAVDQGGYATNPEVEKAKVVAVVDAAIALGIYVIIDFHVHDGRKYQSQAKTFFAEMAQRYGHHPNVIYEPWNEPVRENWNKFIKPYHEAVIHEIRQHDPDNLVVCGTRNWSQKVKEASLNPINDRNVAYTLHYYAATHDQYLRTEAQDALDNGVALFVTEYGTCEASGDGVVDEAESRLWWDFLDKNFISHCNWSVADKEEAASALKPGASATGGWTADQITVSGHLVRDEIKAKN